MKYLLPSLLLSILLLAGCSSAFNPELAINVDKTKVVLSNETLSDFVTVTITRQDNNQNETVLVLNFPDEYKSVYPTDADGNRINELTTKPLKGKNAKDTVQFKIHADNGDAIEAQYILNMELWWNATKKEDAQITVISKD